MQCKQFIMLCPLRFSKTLSELIVKLFLRVPYHFRKNAKKIFQLDYTCTIKCILDFTFQLRLKDDNERLKTRLDGMQNKFGSMAHTKTDLSQQLLMTEEEKLKVRVNVTIYLTT